jgi:hypothetical protein
MTDRVAILFALCLLAVATRPALADSPAPDSAAVADTPSLLAPAAASPAASWAPARDTLEALRARIGDGTIQVWGDADPLGIRHARLDSSGVQFEISEQDHDSWVYERWGIEGPRSESGGAAARRSSLIPWALISRIETQHSRVLLGAAAGSLVGLGALGMVSSSTDMWSDMGALVLAPAIVVSFGLLGAVIGGSNPARAVAWQRPAAASRTRSAGTPVAAPDPAAAADTSSTLGAEEASRAVSSLAQAPPSTGSLAPLKALVGRRAVRVIVGEDDYRLSHPRFDSTGVVFSPGGRQGMSLWAGEGEAPVASPIAWERIDCIRAQHSKVALGAVTGALLGSLVVINAANHSNSDSEIVAATVFAPLVAVVGASVGALLGGSLFASWPIVWQREGARSSSPPPSRR